MSLTTVGVLHEQHIMTEELGLLSVSSETPVKCETVVEELLRAAELLLHQYGAHVSMVIQYFDKLDENLKKAVGLSETEDRIHLLNPLEMESFLADTPQSCSNIYLMSQSVYQKMRELLNGNEVPNVDELIIQVAEHDGLFYGLTYRHESNHITDAAEN